MTFFNNFCEIIENKSGISDDYFKNKKYMPLYNNIKIYKNSYDEFRNGDFTVISNYHLKDKNISLKAIKLLSKQKVLFLDDIFSDIF